MGYQQSLRASEMGLTLNVDVASTAFVEPQPVTYGDTISSSNNVIGQMGGPVRLHHKESVRRVVCGMVGPDAAGACSGLAGRPAEQRAVRAPAPCCQPSCVRPQGDAFISGPTSAAPSYHLVTSRTFNGCKCTCISAGVGHPPGSRQAAVQGAVEQHMTGQLSEKPEHVIKRRCSVRHCCMPWACR